MKKVAVVILNWNGRKLLEEFLPSVVNFTNTEIADIIIADNNSTDDSLEFLSSYYPTLEVIALPQNYGYADGYNKTLKLLNHEYYVLLNSDVEVTANWLDPLYQYIEQHTDVAAIQPKVLAQRNKSCFEYAGAAGGFIDKLGYPFCRGRIFNQVEKDTDQYNTPLEIFWATGGLLECRRIGCFIFCTYGRDRSLLAAQCQRTKTGMSAGINSISCWRCYITGRKSKKNIPQFQK